MIHSTVGDANGDGILDVALAGASGVVAADVTGDGKADLGADSLYSDRFELFTNTCR